MYPRALMRGNPSSATYTQLLWNPGSFLKNVISQFLWQGQQGKKRSTEPVSMLPSPTCPPPRHRALPTYPLSPPKVKSHIAILYRRSTTHLMTPHAASGMFPFHCIAQNIFSVYLPCSYLCYFRKPLHSNKRKKIYNRKYSCSL